MDAQQPTLITAPSTPARDVSPFPKPGDETRVVPGVYGVKMRIVGDDGAINIHFKGQGLDASEKLKRNHSSYMNVSFSRLSAASLTELRKHWANFDAIQTNGELVIMRPLLTLHFRNKRGDETNALELVKIEPYQQTWPAQFDTIEKFSAWCRDFGMDLYAAKAQFGHNYAEWDVPTVEAWAKAAQDKRNEERARMDAELEKMAKAHPNHNHSADDDTVADAETAQGEALGKVEAEAPKHWIDSEEKRKQTFAWLRGHFDERKAPEGEWRKEWLAWQVNKPLGVSSNHIHDYPGTFADFQKEGYAVIQRYDTARAHCVKLLDDANIKADVVTWQTIFNHDRFWDTVASGLSDMEIIKRVEDFAAHNADGIKNAAQSAPAVTTEATTDTKPEKANDTVLMVDKPQKLAPATKPNGAKPVEQTLTPSSLLTELKTLTGISVMEIQRYINRKHDARYVKSIQSKKPGEKWTDLDPIAVRKRLDKVFGFQGLGWRIVPAAGGGQVTCTPYTQHTQKGERPMFAVTMNAYVLEYALVDGAGNVRYVQTSAFSDGDVNDDIGYAHRGAFTSLMKQALKMLGGFDHFMDKASGDNEAA